MTETSPAILVGLLAEPQRLCVVAALALGATSIEEVLAATGLSAREAGVALQRLQAGGLVDEHLVLRTELFKSAAREAAAPPARDSLGYDDVDVERLLQRFVRDGRLLSLPTQRSRRHLVLQHVARDFEVGVRYSEREVDEALRCWAEGSATDHVSLRRYLVDHELLTRGDGEYWRSGGSLGPSRAAVRRAAATVPASIYSINGAERSQPGR